MKKKILTAVLTVSAVGLIVLSVFFIKDYLKLKEYKNTLLSLPEGFTVTAHTGCEGTEENSLEYLNKAMELGVEIIEFDIRFDGEQNPVLAHDAPKGNEVTLEEAFAIVKADPQIKVNVDIKETTALDKIEQCAAEQGILDQIFFTGVNEDFVSAVKEQTDSIPYYLNLSVNKRKATDRAYLEELCNKVKESGAVGINFNYEGATKELVDYFHEQGLFVSIWTVDREKDMHKMLTFAPDNITTRNPVKLKAVISEH